MDANFLTDRGQVREFNEDSGGVFFNSTGQMLAIIADGMGGHKAGDVASQLAVTMTAQKWDKVTEPFCTPKEAETWLHDTLTVVNNSIYREASENEAYTGMGTTVVVALCTDEFISIAHVGDSRCYIYDENGFSQITEDHSLVSELIRSGNITESDAHSHPRKNIVLKALGIAEGTTADTQSLEWETNNKLLLCSDGLTDKVLNEELAEFLKFHKTIKLTGEEMIDLANERGGEDNISLIIVTDNRSNKVGETEC